jgi:MFS family permease
MLSLTSNNLPRRLLYTWIVVIVAVFGSFMSILGQKVINNVLPPLLSVFRTDLGSLQWVITAYTLTQSVTIFFAGRLGPKRFYIITLPLAFAAVLVAIIEGSLVDRYGSRAMLFPRLVLMGAALQKLSEGDDGCEVPLFVQLRPSLQTRWRRTPPAQGHLLCSPPASVLS